MKNFRTFFVAALLLIGTTVWAQDSYKQSVRAYVDACPSAMAVAPEQMTAALSQLNANIMVNYDANRSSQLIKDYLATKFKDDMIDVMASAMEGVLEQANLEYLTQAMLTPQGRSYQEHQAQMNKSSYSDMVEIGQDVMRQIMSGITPADVPCPANCPESYVQLYRKFYDISDNDALVESMMASMGTGANVEKFGEYMKRNMFNLYLKYSYGVMTEDDLKFGINLYGTEAYKQSVQATKVLVNDLQQTGLTIVMSYIEWLRSQGEELTM